MSSTIVITGAGRGLGLCLANRTLEAGWTVFAGTKQPSPALSAIRDLIPSRMFEQPKGFSR
jgi:NAD(P)-dependent dehydrogenase (short-subunit alcohol dehydrogenase family)